VCRLSFSIFTAHDWSVVIYSDSRRERTSVSSLHCFATFRGIQLRQFVHLVIVKCSKSEIFCTLFVQKKLGKLGKKYFTNFYAWYCTNLCPPKTKIWPPQTKWSLLAILGLRLCFLLDLAKKNSPLQAETIFLLQTFLAQTSAEISPPPKHSYYSYYLYYSYKTAKLIYRIAFILFV